MQKITKKLVFGIVTLLFLFDFTSTAFAATAYSIGSLFASGTGYNGDDFRQNAINARNAYAMITDISSYYNTDTNYSYISSTARLGGSRVFFMNGHANNLLIISGSRNTTEYKTGISIYSNGWTSGGFKTAGLNGRNMSSTRLITFAGCQTAGYVGNTNNLTDKAVAQGATAAVGFYESIYSRSNYGPQWLQTYNNSLGSGNSVINSIYAAKVAYPGSNLSDYYTYRGNRDITIGSPSRSAVVTMSKADSILAEVNNSISDTYMTIDLNSSVIKVDSIKEEIRNKNLSDYTSLFSKIINIIEENDFTFDVKNYKITYSVANTEDGYGDIFFKYYIDDKIETNKVYLVTFDNYVVKDIVLAGVKINNLQNTQTVELENLNSKIEKFNNNKATLLLEKLGNKAKSKSILDSSGKIDKASLSGEVLNTNEKYYYDYNTKELKYILETVKVGPSDTFDADALEMVL